MLTPYPRDDGTPAPFPLSAEEVKQILIQTADDINFDARDDVDPPLPQNYSTTIAVPGIAGSERFHSIAGCDQYFGYGRVNADQRRARVAAGRIPPEASIDVAGLVRHHRSRDDAGARHSRPRRRQPRRVLHATSLEVAPGVQPKESDFVVAGSTSRISTQALDGALGDDRHRGARRAHAARHDGTGGRRRRPPDPDRFTFTVRVRVDRRPGQRRRGPPRARPASRPRSAARLSASARQADGVSAPAHADLDGDGTRGDHPRHAPTARCTPSAPTAASCPAGRCTPTPLEIHARRARLFDAARSRRRCTARSSAACRSATSTATGRSRWSPPTCRARLYVWEQRRPCCAPASRSRRCPSTRSRSAPSATSARPRDGCPTAPTATRATTASAARCSAAPALGNLDGSRRRLARDRRRRLRSPPLRLARRRHAGARLARAAQGSGQGRDASIRSPTRSTLKAGRGRGDRHQDHRAAFARRSRRRRHLEVVAVRQRGVREAPNAVFSNRRSTCSCAAGVLEPRQHARLRAVRRRRRARRRRASTSGWNPDAFLPGWPVKTALLTTELLPTVGTGSNGPPALADVDGDGTLEIGDDVGGRSDVRVQRRRRFVLRHATRPART